MSQGHEELDRRRATAALDRISKRRRDEEDKEKSLTNRAKAEAAFRARYARAWVEAPATLASGTYATERGDIDIRQEGSRVIGHATFHEEVPRSILAIALQSLQSVSKKTRVRSIEFEVTLTGRAGRFKMTTTVKDEGSLSGIPDSSSVDGLIVIDPSGRSFDVLEEDKDNTSKIYTARHIDVPLAKAKDN